MSEANYDLKNLRKLLYVDLLELLRKNKREYQENFDKLEATQGTEEHQQYVNRENLLNWREWKIRSALGIPLDRVLVNFCPIGRNFACDGCSGWTVFKEHTDKAGVSYKKNFQCDKSDEGAEKCQFEVRGDML